MAQGKMKMGMVLVIMSMMWSGVVAQSQSCTNALVNLSPCLNYISGNSSAPSSGCCSQLTSVVSSQPQCLCEVLNGGASSFGITINQTQALALPTACRVQTPSITQCKAASPAESPNSNSPGTGSTNVPTTDNGSSGANSVKFSIPVLFLVLASTCAPTFGTLIR
ncbi:hypothetical protein VNO80_16744 [Phaseolus coccineus]|uniref:Bifunctional inhibitor/plant lipid transfer protein/seed storage helical domain-containing protein n=1 Tax=Phaseolus coccineus TaxID=3886 RepID=A0AAN9MTX2_PHACN